MKNNSLAEIGAVLNNAERVCIFCHIRPDGDALGSGLALYAALKNVGKEVYMLCEDKVPEKLSFLPYANKVRASLPFEKSRLDTLIAVDCAEPSRMGLSYGNMFAKFSGVTVNIDHHVSNSGYAKYNYVFNCTASCELMLEILDAAGFKTTKDIADLLAVGLLTDSGNFSHSDVSEKTFLVASKLIAKGADFSNSNYLLFKRQTKARALLFGRVMNKLRFFHDDKIAVVSISLDDLAACNADSAVTEGMVDFPLSIDGIEVAMSVMEVKNGQYKISLRSNGKVNVNAAAAQFGGGGHILASGCMLFGEYEEVIERLVYAVYQQL